MKKADVKIIFDKEDSDKRTDNGWNWFYGTTTINGQTYDFSLCEMNTDVGGQNTTATEITWVDGTPKDAEIIESLIETQFEEEFQSC